MAIGYVAMCFWQYSHSQQLHNPFSYLEIAYVTLLDYFTYLLDLLEKGLTNCKKVAA